MSETIFTFPGKAGDAIMQWPIAYHWAKQHDAKFTVWLDETSCKMVAPLFAAQPCVEKVEMKPGITSYNCGGQPWHFDLGNGDFAGRNVYHLGLRSFPERQLTLETLTRAGVPVDVDIATLANTNSFEVPTVGEKVNRLVLHGQGVCPHTRTTPNFWKFLSSIRGELSMFDEVVFVGSEQDREVGRIAYPDFKAFDDGGSFLTLAQYVVDSRAVMGCGSSTVALAGALKVPCIRVHDPIGSDLPRRIWDNLGDCQLNDTEIGLRKSWPEWRDKWLTA